MSIIHITLLLYTLAFAGCCLACRGFLGRVNQPDKPDPGAILLSGAPSGSGAILRPCDDGRI
jgi:hypothetical protein